MGTESKERNGQHFQVSGVGGSGITHLTTDADQKLLWLHYPNSHLWRMMRTGKGRGKRRNKTRFKKKKIIKDRSKGMVLEAGAWLNDVYSNKAGAEQNKCFIAQTWLETLVHPKRILLMIQNHISYHCAKTETMIYYISGTLGLLCYWHNH